MKLNKKDISKIIGCDKDNITSFIIWTIIVMLIAFFIGYYGEKALDELHKEASINFMMPQTYDENGIFNIDLYNGDKNLQDVSIKIRSCYMSDIDEWDTFYFDELPANIERTIEFKNEITLNRSKRLDCAYGSWEEIKDNFASFNVYKDKRTGNIRVPYQEKVQYGCGSCYWNITIFSEELNKSN